MTSSPKDSTTLRRADDEPQRPSAPEDANPANSRPTQAWRLVVMVFAVLVAGGLVALWPGDRPAAAGGDPAEATTVTATIEGSTSRPCDDAAKRRCSFLILSPTDGPEAGRRVLAAFDPRYALGDRIRAVRAQDGSYAVGDFDRLRPLLIFAALFGFVVLAFGRWHGARALIGLGASLSIVALFMLPALLDGKPAALVALTGALAVAVLTITITYGISAKSVAALLGIAFALGLCIALATVAQHVGHLVGVEYQESPFLRGEQNLGGLVIAGMVIAALGVLDDITISQASTVFALRSANAALGVSELYHRAVAVGRDHVAATVNTLAFAYVGASLPTLFIFALADVPAAFALNTEQVAGQILALLVASIGLVCAVPITTLLAAVFSQLEEAPHEPPAVCVHVHL